MKLINIDGMPNFEVKTTDGKEYVLLPFKHLYDIPTVQAISLDKIKKARAEIKNIKKLDFLDTVGLLSSNNDEFETSKKFAIAILNKLIESEGKE